MQLNLCPSDMSAVVNGTSVNGPAALAVDSSGKLILSKSGAAVIAANNLDIRNLSGSTDSMSVYANSSTEDSDSATIIGLGSRIFLTKDISRYKKNTYVVINTGSVALTIQLQVSPLDNENYYINDGSTFNLLIGGTSIFQPDVFLKYARIKISALLLGSAVVYYYGMTEG